MSEERDLLAAEYVLGTLDASQRAEAERLRASDPDFDRQIRRWEDTFAPLTRNMRPVAPPADVWRKIEMQLPSDSARGGTNVVLLQRRLARWRAATLGVGAIAAGLALVVLDRDLLTTRSGASYVAAVNRGGDKPALIVRVDLANHAITVRSIDAERPAGKSLELWYIAGQHAPKSMGLVGTGRDRMPMPSDMPTDDGIFAVSLEPAGGSPTGAPTGPVLYKGVLVPE